MEKRVLIIYGVESNPLFSIEGLLFWQKIQHRPIFPFYNSKIKI